MTIDFLGVTIGIVQLIISLIIGILFLFASYLFFKILTVKIDDLKELKAKNIAFAIFMGATIFSISWITKFSIQAGMDGIASVIRNPKGNALVLYLFTGGILILQILISGVIAFLSIWVAVQIFIFLTKKIDEIAEIRKNNVAVAIILSVFIISIAIFIEPAIQQILKSLIPYPSIDILPKIK